jgi:hypothetical protein
MTAENIDVFLEGPTDRYCGSRRGTSIRTLRPDEDGPTTAHVSDSLIRHVNPLKTGATVSPRRYMVAFSNDISGALLPFDIEENWRSTHVRGDIGLFTGPAAGSAQSRRGGVRGHNEAQKRPLEV